MTSTVTGFQVMPPLAPEEYQALETSIREHGVQVPITVAPDGRMVDGHHRAEIAAKFDLHCPRVTAKGDDTQLRTLAFELNNHRRQQTREARRAQVRRSLRADPGLSNREHARRTGVDHKTVQVIRADMEATGEIPQSDTRTSADGRERPASRPVREPSAPAVESVPPFDPTGPWDGEQVTARAIQAATSLPPFDPQTGEVLDDTRPEPKQRPLPRSRRTDVVAEISRALEAAESAAERAARIKRSHLTHRQEEAAIWSRRLSVALEQLEGLNNRLQEVSHEE